MAKEKTSDTEATIEMSNPDASDEARAAHQQAAYARNLPSANKPAPAKRKWLVGNDKKPVDAVNELEARAIYNDANGTYPSPKTVPVVLAPTQAA